MLKPLTLDHKKLQKIFKEIGILDHLFYVLRNIYTGQEATVRTRHGTENWFKIGKGVHQGYILLPCLFNLYREYIMSIVRLDESQAGIKIAEKNNNNLRYVDDSTLREETKELLDECEREE